LEGISPGKGEDPSDSEAVTGVASHGDGGRRATYPLPLWVEDPVRGERDKVRRLFIDCSISKINRWRP